MFNVGVYKTEESSRGSRIKSWNMKTIDWLSQLSLIPPANYPRGLPAKRTASTSECHPDIPQIKRQRQVLIGASLNHIRLNSQQMTARGALPPPLSLPADFNWVSTDSLNRCLRPTKVFYRLTQTPDTFLIPTWTPPNLEEPLLINNNRFILRGKAQSLCWLYWQYICTLMRNKKKKLNQATFFRR